MKKTIKLDIDGVLRDCVTPLLVIYNNRFDDDVKYEDIKGWDIGLYISKDPHYGKYFIEHPIEIFRDGPLYNPDTAEILREIKEEYNIHIVTHQFLGLEGYTVDWLHKHKIPYDALSFAKDKRVIKGDYLVDDGAHNLIHNTGMEIPICFDQPWNRDLKGYERVKSLEELARKISVRK